MPLMKLENYPGEDIMACAANAHKQFKIVQSGYAPPVRSGSKLLLKFSTTECEQFNRQVYAMLDLVKKFENKYKLADPKLIATHQDYSKYGPIALIAWLQREHTDLLKDHEWPALASKLPQRNYVSNNNGGSNRVDTRTSYKCYKVGHIATYYPDKTEKTSNVSSTKKPEPAGSAREAKVLASWKYIEPKDILVSHKDDEGREWKFCTKCKWKAKHKKGFFQLTHLDSEHNDDHWKTYKKVEENFTKLNDNPSQAIPLGPPAVTTLEPTSGAEDEDEMTFTGALYAPALPIDSPNDKEHFLPAAYCCPTESKPPALINRHDIYYSDDEDSVEDDTPLSTAVDDGATEPAVKPTKRVDRKKNSRANVQEVLSESEAEGIEWIECDNCCDLKSSIESSCFDKLTVVTFVWRIYMGAMHSLLDFGWTKCVRPPWDLIATPLFWQSTIFLGYVGIFCWKSIHTQHTFATSETISCATQAQEELQHDISVLRKRGVDGLGRNHFDTNGCVPGTGTSILDVDDADQRSIYPHTMPRRSRWFVTFDLRAISITWSKETVEVIHKRRQK
jgi:hypothetical protein